MGATMRVFLTAIVVSSLLSFADLAAAIDISTCGQQVPDGEIGILTTDLVCDSATTAVRLGIGSTLELDGRSIVVPDGWGVWCGPAARCTIVGGNSPGEIGRISGGETGVYLQRNARLVMSDVAIEDCVTGIGAEAWHAPRGAKAMLSNVVVTGSVGTALRVGLLNLKNVTLEGNPGHGIVAGASSRLKANGLVVRGNAFSEDCEAFGCSGIDVGTVRGRDFVVSDNNGIGIYALFAKLADSTVINNIRAGSGKDLVTSEIPRLRNVVCNASRGWGSQSLTPWGVCALDE